jgi:hypothetical protein
MRKLVGLGMARSIPPNLNADTLFLKETRKTKTKERKTKKKKKKIENKINHDKTKINQNKMNYN